MSGLPDPASVHLGQRANSTVTAGVRRNADGTVPVQFDTSGQRDPALLDRVHPESCLSALPMRVGLRAAPGLTPVSKVMKRADSAVPGVCATAAASRPAKRRTSAEVPNGDAACVAYAWQSRRR